MKTIFKNAFYLLFSNVVVRLYSAITIIIVAKHIGTSDYGKLSVALAFTAVAAYFTDIGLTHTFIREVTKKNSNLNKLTSSLIKIKIAIILLTITISVILVKLLYNDGNLSEIIFLVAIPTIIGTSIQGIGEAYYQATQEMKYTALIRGISGVISGSTFLIGIALDWNIYMIASIYGFSSLFGATLSLVILSKKVRLISLKKGWDPSLLKGLLPFSITGLVVMMLPQLGPLTLERVTTLAQVGIFAAAYRIPMVLYKIPGTVATAFYPLLFKYGNNKDYSKHLELCTLEMKIMSFLGIIISIPFLFYSEFWLHLLLGQEWTKGSTVLTILSIMVIIQSINFPLADALTTLGDQLKRMFIMTFALFLGIICYLFMGSKWGSFGGGIAAVITEISMTLLFIIVMKKGITLFTKGAFLNLFSLILIVPIKIYILDKLTIILGLPIIFSIYIAIVLFLDKKLRSFVLSKISILRMQLKRRIKIGT